MLEAVRQNGYALEYAGPGLKEDRALVLEAVRQIGIVRAEGGPRVHATGVDTELKQSALTFHTNGFINKNYVL